MRKLLRRAYLATPLNGRCHQSCIRMGGTHYICVSIEPNLLSGDWKLQEQSKDNSKFREELEALITQQRYQSDSAHFRWRRWWEKTKLFVVSEFPPRKQGQPGYKSPFNSPLWLHWLSANYVENDRKISCKDFRCAEGRSGHNNRTVVTPENIQQLSSDFDSKFALPFSVPSCWEALMLRLVYRSMRIVEIHTIVDPISGGRFLDLSRLYHILTSTRTIARREPSQRIIRTFAPLLKTLYDSACNILNSCYPEDSIKVKVA